MQTTSRGRSNIQRIAISTIIGLIASVIGIVSFISFPYFLLDKFGIFKNSPPNQNDINLLFLSLCLALFVVGIILFIMFLFATRMNSQIMRQRETIAVLRSKDNIFNEKIRAQIYVARTLEYMQSRVNEHLSTAFESAEETQRKSEALCLSIVNNTKNIFDRLVQQDCSCCIKLTFVNEGDVEGEDIKESADVMVHTFIRDRVSDLDRKGVNNGKPYRCGENTAFRNIISPEHQHKVFISNDLKALRLKGEYNNSNHLYPKFYNACAVVPIINRPKDSSPAFGEGENIIHSGFLCVDSKNGKFNEEHTIALLRLIAQMVGHCIPTSTEWSTDIERGEPNEAR